MIHLARARSSLPNPELAVSSPLLREISLKCVSRRVEHAPVPDGATQLDVFSVRPEERAHRSRWFSAKEVALRHVIRVPHLLRNEAGVRRILRHHSAQLFGPLHISAKELVVRALSDQ